MLKNFTKILCPLLVLLSFKNLTAQTVVVWPTTDSATIRASQFSDSSQIFKPTVAVPTPPSGFTGWVSKAISSSDPAKLINTQWDWTRNGKGDKGSYYGTLPPVGSATASNGAAIFNSDFLDSRGASVTGSGISPGPHAADLISPNMNLTGQNDLTLVFNQFFRNLTATTRVTWSEDGGTTWRDTISLMDNVDIVTNTLINSLVAVKLPKSKGSANFKVKFIFSGRYYFWTIDDVKVVSNPSNLRVNSTWYALPPNIAMTRQQVDTIVFQADIENQGNKTATNVKLTVDIRRDADNVSVYNVVRNYGSIRADSVAENEVFGKWLPPSTGTGTVGYTGSYVITSDSADAYPLNDTIRFPFALTDSLFRNDAGTNFSSVQPGGGVKSWKIGNYFYFPKGTGVTATRIQIFVDTFTMINANLVGRLYAWNDSNNDGLVQETERTEVAAGEALVPRVTTNPVAVNLLLQNTVSAGAIQLKDKTSYIAMVEFEQPSPSVSMYASFSRTYRNFPMHEATRIAGRPRYSGVINSDPALPWSTNVFGGFRNNTPRVSMWSWPIKTDTKEPLSANNKIELFPNPTSSSLNVAFDLEKMEQAVLVRVIDMTGKIIKERDYQNLKKDTITLDVNDVPNGVYNIQIQTIGNFRTMRFVKAN